DTATRSVGFSRIASAPQDEARMMDYFFFQAEDGIRDKLVTGVQTCALPISALSAPHRPQDVLKDRGARGPSGGLCGGDRGDVRRSEERRVGKECRSRWGRYH